MYRIKRRNTAHHHVLTCCLCWYLDVWGSWSRTSPLVLARLSVHWILLLSQGVRSAGFVCCHHQQIERQDRERCSSHIWGNFWQHTWDDYQEFWGILSFWIHHKILIQLQVCCQISLDSAFVLAANAIENCIFEANTESISIRFWCILLLFMIKHRPILQELFWMPTTIDNRENMRAEFGWDSKHEFRSNHLINLHGNGTSSACCHFLTFILYSL